MPIFARGGPFKAGVGACIISICLWPNIGLSQTNVAPLELVEGSETNSRLLQLLQEQHQTVLKAIDHIQQNAEITLDAYTLAVVEQMNLLKGDLISYREQDLEVMRGLNQHTETVTLVAAGLAIFILLLNAVILFWGMNGMTARLTAILKGSLSGTVNAAVIAGGDSALTLDNPATQASARLLDVIERLDKRLLDLETRARPQKNSIVAAEAKPKIAVQPDLVPAPAKPGEVPRVSITLGEGSALAFLPQAVEAMKLQAWWSRVQKWKRALRRPRP
jgi:hypothetical protein